MSDQLEYLKRKYKDIPIPKELDTVIQRAIMQGKKKQRRVNWSKKLIGAGAVAAIMMVAGINTSPAFAKAISNVPLVGSLVKVLTFTEFTVNEDNAKANIKVPAITNMENKTLESTLNHKYLEESKKLYKDFMTEMEVVKNSGGGHVGIESGYEIKTDNDHILSIGRYVTNTVGTSSTTFTYNTIDKQKQQLITLPSLFKDNRYIQLISENIKEQMKQQMKSNSDKTYWLEGGMGFTTIAQHQNFYINNDGKLVISFQKYDVAPGYMGVVEFIIPTQVIADILASHEYVK